MNENVGWYIIGNDYPYLPDVLPAVWFSTDSFTEPYPKWMWRIPKGDGNDYPYIELEKAHTVSPVDQLPYITIHDMNTPQDGFENNGIRILMPTRCEITQELNGQYELVMEHPIDEDGAWKSIREFNVIKVGGQLFPIYRVVSRFSGNQGTITAYAKHMFYMLSDWWMERDTIMQEIKIDAEGKEIIPEGITCKEFINLILDKMLTGDDHGGSFLVDKYIFNGNSSIDKKVFINKYSEISAAEAIMGSDAESLVNAFGGEIYRDNFYFSINEKMEGARENAFNIRVGLNLTGIERDADYSDFCSQIICYSNFGWTWSWWWIEEGGIPYVFPHNVVRSVTFNYDENNFSPEKFQEDSYNYWLQVRVPKVTYTIDLVSLKMNPDYQQFNNLKDLKVGDTGNVYDERLEINLDMKVTKTITNAITGEVTSVTFGDRKLLTKSGGGVTSRIQTKLDKRTQEEIKKAEILNMGRWENLTNYSWLRMEQFTWNEANGG